MAERLKPLALSVAVDESETEMSADPLWARQVTLLNLDDANTIYVGGEGVTTAAGFPVAPGASLAIDPNQATADRVKQINLNDIKAICETGETAEVRLICLITQDD